jgi:hypothetical protein
MYVCMYYVCMYVCLRVCSECGNPGVESANRVCVE